MNCPVRAGAGLSWRFQDGEAARKEAIGRLLSQAPLLESLGRAMQVELGAGQAVPERLRRILFSTFYQGFLHWLNAGRDIEGVARERRQSLKRERITAAF